MMVGDPTIVQCRANEIFLRLRKFIFFLVDLILKAIMKMCKDKVRMVLKFSRNVTLTLSCPSDVI